MSHGPSDSGVSAEPNLTPLLDVVLQLLMFFMMCVNFVTEQVSGDVKLPVSQSARPMDKAETDVLFINVKPYHQKDFEKRQPEDREKIQQKFQDGDPCIIVLGKPIPLKVLELKSWLSDMYKDAEARAKDGKVNTAIIIRAHEDCEYAQVYTILNMCKLVGYKQMKLRAMTKAGAGGG
jgi:biopolymer transport protein ExbD